VRRIFGYIMFTLGWLLVFLAPLLYLYTKPRVEKAPNDVYEVTRSFGSGRIFSAKTFHVEGPMPVENVSIARSDTEASSKQIAVISIFQRTINLQTGGDIDYQLDVYCMDRASGYAVHCPSEQPRHEGLTLKFPFGTKKQTYPFYDSTAHAAFPAQYLRTEKLEGMDTYVFRSDVPQTSLGTLVLPGSVIGSSEPGIVTFRWYKATTTVWVEPITGAIVKGAQVASQWTTNGGQYVTTLADTDFVNSQDSIAHIAEKVRTKVWQLRLVEYWVPFFGPVIGLGLIVLGLIMLATARPVSRRFVPEPAEAVA
jgi:hypothetical protein